VTAAGAATADRVVLLAGLPRSGTTLAVRLLQPVAGVVALNEPLRFLDERPRAEHVERIGRFLREQRHSIVTRRRALSATVGGEIADNTVAAAPDASGRRSGLAEWTEIEITKPLDPDFTLLVKDNSAFTALLDLLAPRFRCFAMVRNPLPVLASWASVGLPVGRGHVPAAERIDPALRARLASVPDLLERQFLILDWFFERFASLLPRERVLTYEDLVATRGRSLAALAPAAATLDADLASRNRVYDSAKMRELARRLVARPGAWRTWYTPESVEALAAG
jgi:hypothetical protein